MKSRTNAQQELMRQQIIEEERNNQLQKFQNPRASPTNFKSSKSSPRNTNAILTNDKNTLFNKGFNSNEMKTKPIITISKTQSMDSQINKRQRSFSYSVMSNNCQTKLESFSPATKSPMDLAFSNLGNDDVLDWNQIEPSITTTSEISQDLFDQMARSQHNTIHESFMETGTEENDSLQDDQSVSSIKPSTSCPTNMAHPIHLTPGQTIHLNQHLKAAQKPMPNIASVTGVIEDPKLQWIRDRNKKDCHNRIERKRRDYINNQIQELGQLLPEKLFLSTESKRNKGGILKNSVIYIQQLQQVLTCLQHLQKETQISENLISAFYERAQYLENLLTESGINFEQNVNEKTTLQDWFNIHQHNSHLLQNVNSIQSSWSSDQGHNDNGSNYNTSYDDMTVKSEDVSAENVLNSVSIGRMQSSNSGAGGSSSGTPSVTNYNSPCNTNSLTNTTNQSNNNNNNNNINQNLSTSRPLSVHSANINIVNVNSPQQRHSQVYGSSQPFSKTGTKPYEHTSKPCISDSPVLSSILIGSAGSNAAVKVNYDHQSGSRQQLFNGHSNSVPDDCHVSYLTQNINTENISGERYYLIPISKSKGIQLVANDLKNSRGIIKLNNSSLSNNDDPVLSRIQTEPSVSPRITVLNSYSIGHDDDVHNFIEVSPNQNDNDDSLMGEFEFDDIPME